MQSLPRRTPRPPLQQRHDLVLSLADVNELLEILNIAYKQTPTEHIQKALRKLNGIRDTVWGREEGWRLDEIDECLENLNEFPHSVRTWMLYYREKELE